MMQFVFSIALVRRQTTQRREPQRYIKFIKANHNVYQILVMFIGLQKFTIMDLI